MAYVYKYNVLEGIKDNGKFLLNTIWSPEELEEKLPAEMKRFKYKKWYATKT